MNSYDLSRKFVDFSFENPSKIKPNHYALYFFAIEHCNRLGWKKEFGLPTTMTMEAIGIRSYNTYSVTFNDLVDFGFFNLVQRSTNQYSANIIALSNFNKALDKALDKAFIKHGSKQGESIDSVDKQVNKEQRTKNNIPTEEVFIAYAVEQVKDIKTEAVRLKYRAWVEGGWETGGDKPKPIKNWKTTLLNTLTYIEKDASKKPFKYQP